METTKTYRYWIIFVLTCNTFINAVDRASLSVAAPQIIRDMHLTPSWMGIALSAFFWPYALLNVPAGTLADKYGAKKVLGWSVAIWSIFSGATGLAKSFPSLVIARIGVGVGEAAGFPVVAKVVATNIPSEQRGSAIGIIWMGIRLGAAAAPVLMAALIHGWGWQTAFVVTGIGSLLWCVLWYFGYKEKDAPGGTRKEKVTIPWRRLLTSRATIGLVITKFFQDYLLYMFLTWVPSYLAMERGFGIMKTGVYASLPWLAALVAQPLCGWVSDRLMRSGMSLTMARKSVMVSAQVLAASVMAVGYIQDPVIAVCVLSLSIAAEAGAGGLVWVLLTEVAPEKHTASMGGIMNTSGAIAGVLSPIITGFIVSTTGSFNLALLTGGVMLLISALAVLFIVPEMKRVEVDDAPSPANLGTSH